MEQNDNLGSWQVRCCCWWNEVKNSMHCFVVIFVYWRKRPDVRPHQDTWKCFVLIVCLDFTLVEFLWRANWSW